MTLRNLSKATPLSLQEWLFIVKRANLDIDADTELTSEYNKILVDECQKYMLLKQRALKQRREEQAAAERKKTEQECPEKEPAFDSAEDESSKEAKALQSLDRLIKENQVFLDLSSLYAPQSTKAWPNLIPVLRKHNRKLRIPRSVMKALIASARDKENIDRAELAKNSLTILRELNNESLVDIRESVDANSTPSQDLMTICAHFRMEYPLLIITQDPELTKDLLEQNNLQSANGKNISIKKFNKYGYVSNVIDKPRPPVRRNPFRVATQIRQEPDQVLKTTSIPGEGDLIYTNSNGTGSIRLEARLGEGGEGAVYSTNTPYVAKIYKPECCTAYRREKILQLAAAKLSYEGICFPIDALYNQHGEFVGYLMQKAEGHTLRYSVMSKPRMLDLFRDWDKADVVQLCITILKKINYIHDNGLLLGDINPQNILVNTPTEVYFVDTDSYQVNDLPCPVGVPTYTAPELIQMQKDSGRSYAEILRSKANENFAVATLLFMILMPGKNPYAHAGGGSPVENILTMHFPYALGEKGSDRAPGGAWRLIWSHLPYRVKETFHQTFTKQEGKSDYNMKERLSVYNWIIVMQDYRDKLERVKSRMDEYNAAIAAGKIDPLKDPPPEDEQDLWLYPDRLKWTRDKDTRTYNLKRCRACGKWAPVNRMRHGCCNICREKGETVTCEICGTEFVFSDYDKEQGFKRPRFCSSCHRKRKQIVYEGTCEMPGCFNKVSLNAIDLEWFESKGLPKACDFCKKTNKTFARHLVKNNRNDRSVPRVDSRTAETSAQRPVRTEQPVVKANPKSSDRGSSDTSSTPAKKPSLLELLWKSF